MKSTAIKPGRLIVIDGIDQSGKKTQAELLARKVRHHGFSCVIWSFPAYHTLLGQRLKAYLAGKERPNLRVIHLLYAANKWEVATKINEQRARGTVVIANRYTPSNLAYGVAHDLSLNWLTILEADLPKPNRIFILDVPVRIAFGRKIQQRDIHEEDATYLERVRRMYLQLARKFNWTVIDGKSTPLMVHSRIWKVLERSFKKE